MSDCIFCRIVAGELPSQILYENDEFLVLFDAFPSGLGHTLVLPKAHHENIMVMDSDKCGRLFALAQQVGVALQTALDCPGVNVLQNNGACAGQTVFHTHVHVVPRYPNDHVRIGWDTCKPDQNQAEHLAEQVRHLITQAF